MSIIFKLGKWILYLIITIFFMMTSLNTVSANNYSNNSAFLSGYKNEFNNNTINHFPSMNHNTYTNKSTIVHLLGNDKDKTMKLKSHVQIKVIIPHQRFTLIQFQNQKGYVDNQSLFQKSNKLDLYWHKFKEFLRFKDLIIHFS